MSSENKKNINIDRSNVLSGKSINSKFSMAYGKDIAPVHSSASKIMASPKESNISPSKSLHWADVHARDNKLSKQFNEKLDLNSKKCEFNGTNIITADVEVHCIPGVNNCTKEKMFSETMCNEVKNRAVNNCKATESAIVSQESLANGTTSQKYSLSNTASLSKLHNETNCIAKCIEKTSHANDGLCNGYSVSEATSSNSIDVSASSDKSFDSTASSKKLTSNNSQSQQPHDINFTFGSEGYKIPEIKYSSVSISVDTPGNDVSDIAYVNYLNENQMSSIMKLIQKDLSEPYSIYTYRYFIHNWPKLCFLAIHHAKVVGAIVCKLDMHKKTTVRGYIAMLAVDEKYRKKKIGSNLVLRAIRAMAKDEADEVVLETEITNQPALKLYENLGFVRDKRLFRYYLNGVDALRLKLWLR